MTDAYQLLGITAAATAAEIKAAYHRQLRQYPAHSHPQEFQRIRTAYEQLRQIAAQPQDPLQPRPWLQQLDADALAALAALEERVRKSSRIDLATLLRLTL